MFLAGPSVPGSRPPEGRSVHWAPVASAVTVACLPHGPLAGAGLSQGMTARARQEVRASLAPRDAPHVSSGRSQELGRQNWADLAQEGKVHIEGRGASSQRPSLSSLWARPAACARPRGGTRPRWPRLALAGFSLLRARCSLSEGVLEPDGGERKARVRGTGFRAWDLERRRPLRFLQRERLQSRLSGHSEGRTLGPQRDSGHGSCLSCLPSRGNRRSGQVTPRVPGGSGGFRARTWCRGSSVLPRSPGLSPRRSPQTVACRLCCC